MSRFCPFHGRPLFDSAFAFSFLKVLVFTRTTGDLIWLLPLYVNVSPVLRMISSDVALIRPCPGFIRIADDPCVTPQASSRSSCLYPFHGDLMVLFLLRFDGPTYFGWWWILIFPHIDGQSLLEPWPLQYASGSFETGRALRSQEQNWWAGPDSAVYVCMHRCVKYMYFCDAWRYFWRCNKSTANSPTKYIKKLSRAQFTELIQCSPLLLPFPCTCRKWIHLRNAVANCKIVMSSSPTIRDVCQIGFFIASGGSACHVDTISEVYLARAWWSCF